MKRLFLDDFRNPKDCISYMSSRYIDSSIYAKEWDIVRSYQEFVVYLATREHPSVISFDHDLSDGHYNMEFQTGEEAEMIYDSQLFLDNREKTGYHCAEVLIEYYRKLSLPLPECIVHSMNPVGRLNIEQLLNSARK